MGVDFRGSQTSGPRREGRGEAVWRGGRGAPGGGGGVAVQREVGTGTNSSLSAAELGMRLQGVAYVITAERVTGLPRRTASWPVLITSSLQ